MINKSELVPQNVTAVWRAKWVGIFGPSRRLSSESASLTKQSTTWHWAVYIDDEVFTASRECQLKMSYYDIDAILTDAQASNPSKSTPLISLTVSRKYLAHSSSTSQP